MANRRLIFSQLALLGLLNAHPQPSAADQTRAPEAWAAIKFTEVCGQFVAGQSSHIPLVRQLVDELDLLPTTSLMPGQASWIANSGDQDTPSMVLRLRQNSARGKRVEECRVDFQPMDIGDFLIQLNSVMSIDLISSETSGGVRRVVFSRFGTARLGEFVSVEGSGLAESTVHAIFTRTYPLPP